MKAMYTKWMLLGLLSFVLQPHVQAQSQRGLEKRTQRRGFQSGQPTFQHEAFLDRAIEIHEGELELSQLAAGKAEDARVVQFAEMMVADHIQALERIRSLKNDPNAGAPATQDQPITDGQTGDQDNSLATSSTPK